MPKFWPRKPKPSVEAPSTEAVVTGMFTFITDLLAGDRLAVDLAGPLGEMPMDAAEWAAYSTSPYRLERMAHFGGPSPADLPDTH